MENEANEKLIGQKELEENVNQNGQAFGGRGIFGLRLLLQKRIILGIVLGVVVGSIYSQLGLILGIILGAILGIVSYFIEG